jgi:hypothetical protein
MSTKFEQLLDLLVNEDMEGANALFHEIVVEKSRDIYENLIAEEADDEEMDEAKSEDDEEMDEAKEEDDEQDESVEESADDEEEMDESDEELEDSYMMDGDDTGDATDDFGGEVSADGDNFDAPADDEHGHEGQEDSAIMDIKNAIAELEAAFAELEAAQGGEEAEMGMEPEFGDESGEDDEMMGSQAFESRKLREYSEKVGNDWEKNSHKTQGAYLGAGTGEKQSAPVEGKSAISSGKGKPESGANAKNLNQSYAESEANSGTSPAKVNKGINPEKGEKFAKGIHNVDGVKSGVKTLSKQGAGYPGNNKTAGPVGSGTGDKAGQTSVGQVKSPINGAPNRNA